MKFIENIVGKGETYGTQLAPIAKLILGKRFKGVFRSEDLDKDKVKEGEVCIVNKDEHWMGVFREKGKLYEIDSFHLDNLGHDFKDFNVPKDFRQSIFETNCGQRLLVLFSWLSKNKTL